jgi:hypothetical protein
MNKKAAQYIVQVRNTETQTVIETPVSTASEAAKVARESAGENLVVKILDRASITSN